MVEDAPKFYEVAKRIVEMTEGTVFVAHNARFDYSFIRQEFSMLGYNFKRPLLDTVALSRKLLPGHKSYSLGKLCSELGIEINGRHRASGDALATVRLLELLLERDSALQSGSLIRNRKASKLHPALDMARLQEIPEEPGVYYFYNEEGDVIYVGKSCNLFQRVNTHLSNNTSARAMEMRSMIADITWETTGSELIALLLESAEIKKKKPLFNRAQRRTGYPWGIYSFSDPGGYLRFEYRRVAGDTVPLSLFTSRDNARGRLEQLMTKYELCQKLCGLYDTDGPCFHRQVSLCRGACCGEEKPAEYNERAMMALDEFIFRERNFFVIDRGRNAEERSAVKIINGKYAGYGFFNINEMGFGLEAVHDCIVKAADTSDIQMILKSWLKNHRVERIIDF
jgi:DNA polymerase-3 subunit epsilon